MLNAAQIAQFHRDGFIAIRGLFQGRELDDLRRAADEVVAEGLAGKGEHHQYHTRPDGQKVYYRSEWMWERQPIFRAATVNPRLLAAIGQCIGRPFLPMNDSFVCKVPRGNVPILWHQDPPYGFLGEKCHRETFEVPNFDTDIYLDHSTIENGCVWGIPGRHLVGKVDVEKYSQDELFTRFGAVPMVMAPGDVLFHCLSAPHGSIGNTTNSIRRIFYVHYMAQEVVEHCYPEWTGDQDPRHRGFNPQGLAYVQQMLDARLQLGLGGLTGSQVTWDEHAGFKYTGLPTTPRDHWRQLIAAIPPAELARQRQLQPV